MSDELVTVHTEQVEKQAPAVQSKSEDILESVKAAEIIGDSTRAAVATIMRDAAELKKSINELWEPICSATNKAHKSATGARGEMLKPVQEAEKLAKEKLKAYDMEQRRIAEESRRKIEAEQKEDNAPAPIEPVKKQNDVIYVDHWKARIVDINKLDRQYMMPDIEKLNRLAKAMEGENAPAGVEFYNDPIARRK